MLDFICSNSKERADVMETKAFQTLSPALLHEIIANMTPHTKVKKFQQQLLASLGLAPIDVDIDGAISTASLDDGDEL